MGRARNNQPAEQIKHDVDKTVIDLQELIGDNTLTCLVLAGSHSYGMATEDSDVDLRGAYTAPKDRFLGLESRRPENSMKMKDTDTMAFEIGHLLNMFGNANPNVVEMIWQPTIFRSPEWDAILSNKNIFLSQRIQALYAAYAGNAIKNMNSLGQSDLSIKRMKASSKHVIRLLSQARQLCETGEIKILVNPEEIISTVDSIVEKQDTSILTEMLKEFINDCKYSNLGADLPEKVNWERINRLLISLR